MKNQIFYFLYLTLGVLLMVFFSSCQKSSPTITSTESLFSAMKQKNDGKWYQNFTFKQHTIRFDEYGEQTDSTVWYEAVSYPYNFRIDRNIDKAIYTIYKNDSTYNFQNDSLISSIPKPATHLVFKGGLYFISLAESISKLQKYGYDTNVFRKDKFMDQPVYVIGSDGNQIWLHAFNYYCMRRIYTTSSDKKVDVVYEDFKPLGEGWVEQKVTFYIEGKKRLEEFYFDIKIKPKIDSKIFNLFQNEKWYLNY